MTAKNRICHSELSLGLTSPRTLGDIEQSKLRRKSVFSIAQRPQIGRQRTNIEPPVRGACPNAQISKGMPPTLPPLRPSPDYWLGAQFDNASNESGRCLSRLESGRSNCFAIILIADMRLLFLNVTIICLVGTPLLILEVARSCSSWIYDHHGGLSFAVWLLILAAVYFWVLPLFGLHPNWHVLAP